MRSPESVLRDVLRKLQVGSTAALTYERMPQLEVVTKGLAWHFTDRVNFPLPPPHVSKVSLISLCIKCAFEWMNYAMTDQGISLRGAQTSYLAGLLYHSPEITHVRVSASDEEWDPFSGDPLGSWLPLRPGAQIEVRDIQDSGTSFNDQQIRLGLLQSLQASIHLSSLDADLASVLSPPERLHPPKN